jgi:hypothetical protein
MNAIVRHDNRFREPIRAAFYFIYYKKPSVKSQAEAIAFFLYVNISSAEKGKDLGQFYD